MRRAPIRIAGENVVRAADLKSFGAVEIRPYPSEPPAASELSVPEVSRAIRRERGEDFHRTVLGLKRIVRRNNVFRDAVALVFAADAGDDVQVAFAIGGRLSESHERAFAWHGGPRKMGFVRIVAGDLAQRRVDRLLGRELLRDRVTDERLRAIRQEEAAGLAQVLAIEPAFAMEGASKPAKRALAEAEERLARTRHELARMPIRSLACYEQDELLAEAVANAGSNLLVTSAGLQPTIVNGYILRDIDRAIADGAKIQIATFLQPQPDPRTGDRYDPLSELTKRSADGRLQLVQANRGEFFFLVQDDRLGVISTRPFLGDVVRRSGFARVEGYVARDPRIVARIRQLALQSATPKKRG